MGFAEVEVGYGPEEATLEALRCLRCFDNVMLDADLCILCGLCVDVCPTNCITIARADTIGLGDETQSVLLLGEDHVHPLWPLHQPLPPRRPLHGTRSGGRRWLSVRPRNRHHATPSEPKTAFAPGRGLTARIERSNVWRSMFRHPNLDTPRGRALQSFSNFFLHLYPVKVPARVLRIRYSFRLGFIASVLFVILVVTGVYLMFFYTPAVGSAYGDMQHLRTSVGFGQLVRNVHRWSAHLMVLVVVLHLARTFFAGAYKKPREFNWVLGVTLLLLTLGLSFTGYLLPWDQLSYWAVTVGTNLVQYVPLLGNVAPEPPHRR